MRKFVFSNAAGKVKFILETKEPDVAVALMMASGDFADSMEVSLTEDLEDASIVLDAQNQRQLSVPGNSVDRYTRRNNRSDAALAAQANN